MNEMWLKFILLICAASLHNTLSNASKIKTKLPKVTNHFPKTPVILSEDPGLLFEVSEGHPRLYSDTRASEGSARHSRSIYEEPEGGPRLYSETRASEIRPRHSRGIFESSQDGPRHSRSVFEADDGEGIDEGDGQYILQGTEMPAADVKRGTKSGARFFRHEEQGDDGRVTGQYGFVDAAGDLHVVIYALDELGHRIRTETHKLEGYGQEFLSRLVAESDDTAHVRDAINQLLRKQEQTQAQAQSQMNKINDKEIATEFPSIGRKLETLDETDYLKPEKALEYSDQAFDDTEQYFNEDFVTSQHSLPKRESQQYFNEDNFETAPHRIPERINNAQYGNDGFETASQLPKRDFSESYVNLDQNTNVNLNQDNVNLKQDTYVNYYEDTNANFNRDTDVNFYEDTNVNLNQDNMLISRTIEPNQNIYQNYEPTQNPILATTQAFHRTTREAQLTNPEPYFDVSDPPSSQGQDSRGQGSQIQGQGSRGQTAALTKNTPGGVTQISQQSNSRNGQGSNGNQQGSNSQGSNNQRSDFQGSNSQRSDFQGSNSQRSNTRSHEGQITTTFFNLHFDEVAQPSNLSPQQPKTSAGLIAPPATIITKPPTIFGDYGKDKGHRNSNNFPPPPTFPSKNQGDSNNFPPPPTFPSNIQGIRKSTSSSPTASPLSSPSSELPLSLTIPLKNSLTNEEYQVLRNFLRRILSQDKSLLDTALLNKLDVDDMATTLIQASSNNENIKSTVINGGIINGGLKGVINGGTINGGIINGGIINEELLDEVRSTFGREGGTDLNIGGKNSEQNNKNQQNFNHNNQNHQSNQNFNQNNQNFNQNNKNFNQNNQNFNQNNKNFNQNQQIINAPTNIRDVIHYIPSPDLSTGKPISAQGREEPASGLSIPVHLEPPSRSQEDVPSKNATIFGPNSVFQTIQPPPLPNKRLPSHRESQNLIRTFNFQPTTRPTTVLPSVRTVSNGLFPPPVGTPHRLHTTTISPLRKNKPNREQTINGIIGASLGSSGQVSLSPPPLPPPSLFTNSFPLRPPPTSRPPPSFPQTSLPPRSFPPTSPPFLPTSPPSPSFHQTSAPSFLPTSPSPSFPQTSLPPFNAFQPPSARNLPPAPFAPSRNPHAPFPPSQTPPGAFPLSRSPPAGFPNRDSFVRSARPSIFTQIPPPTSHLLHKSRPIHKSAHSTTPPPTALPPPPRHSIKPPPHRSTSLRPRTFK